MGEVIRLTEGDLHKIVENAVSKAIKKTHMEEKKYEMPVKGKKKNQPCFDKEGNFLGWFSRSMAVVNFIFCKNKKGRWGVLASVRGEGTPDPELRGSWNCPCGYLDWNETLEGAAVRELREETGLHVSEDDLELEGINSDPKDDKRQNVTFHFVGVLVDVESENFRFSHAENEKDEVGEIKFIDLCDADKYKWAFNHDTLLKKYASMYNL